MKYLVESHKSGYPITEIVLSCPSDSSFKGIVSVFSESFERHRNPENDIEVLILEKPGNRDFLETKIVMTDFKLTTPRDIEALLKALECYATDNFTILGKPVISPTDLGSILAGGKEIARYSFKGLEKVEIVFNDNGFTLGMVMNRASNLVKEAMCAATKITGPVRKHFENNVLSGYEVTMWHNGKKL